MKPVEFAGANVVFAKDQPEYLPLPAFIDRNDEYGRAVTCWGMTWRERLRALFIGRVYVTLMTFHKPLQPLKLSITSPMGESA